MEIIDFENAAESFYRDRYGLSIEDLPFPVRKSLENLYFRGKVMPAATLYSKLTGCGIQLRPGVMLRTRMYSLIKRIPQEQQQPFTQEEIEFLMRNFPAQVNDLCGKNKFQNHRQGQKGKGDAAAAVVGAPDKVVVDDE